VKPTLACFGSSLVSAYWNGAATYYRGIFRALAARGWSITFFEPDAYDRQAHRDMPDPDWATDIVYDHRSPDDIQRVLDAARDADIVVKTSGVGVCDELLEAAVLDLRRPGQMCVFWDVDAAATLERMEGDPQDSLRGRIGDFDLVLTYGGGPPVVSAYTALGAKACVPIYNALDPETHYPVPPDARFASDLSLLANRLPDRETRIDEFFFTAARRLGSRRFLLAGNGWQDKAVPGNVTCVGHLYTRDHNAFNGSATAVLNVNRDSMARVGYSPATRVFEAAGAGACVITDAWEGVETFFEPGRELLVAVSGDEVAEQVAKLTPARARAIGRAARERALASHTYAHRVADVESALGVGVAP
jgi:spore maturation protein CgeB